MKFFITILSILITLNEISSSVFNPQQLSNRIRPNTDEKTQQNAAKSVIRRLLPPENADNVAIKINFNLPGNYFKVSLARIGKV
jgi:hypothetical protein